MSVTRQYRALSIVGAVCEQFKLYPARSTASGSRKILCSNMFILQTRLVTQHKVDLGPLDDCIAVPYLSPGF